MPAWPFDAREGEEDRLAELDLAELRELRGATPGQAQRMHDGMPVLDYDRGEPVPDLSQIPQENWLDVLRPLGQPARRSAMSRLSLEEVSFALQVMGELVIEDGNAAARARQAGPPRLPAAGAPSADASAPRRQVNFRLGAREFERLEQAARLFGMSPTTLARVLTVRGVALALYEERRDR